MPDRPCCVTGRCVTVAVVLSALRPRPAVVPGVARATPVRRRLPVFSRVPELVRGRSPAVPRPPRDGEGRISDCVVQLGRREASRKLCLLF
eukprot:scaffold286_cov247-Pinguiococcus_pyrenoidosus.AAC.11